MNAADPRLPMLRAELAASPIGAVLVPEALAPVELAPIRARVATADFRDYFIADRGRYRVSELPVERALLEGLVELAAALTGAYVRPAFARWTRLAHGDYAQPKDDALFWSARGGGRALDLTLDLSASASDEAQLIYSNGAGALVLPQTPGCLALVDRHRPLIRYERYVNHRAGAAEVLRLRLVLDVTGETRGA